MEEKRELNRIDFFSTPFGMTLTVVVGYHLVEFQQMKEIVCLKESQSFAILNWLKHFTSVVSGIIPAAFWYQTDPFLCGKYFSERYNNQF